MALACSHGFEPPLKDLGHSYSFHHIPHVATTKVPTGKLLPNDFLEFYPLAMSSLTFFP